MNVNTNGKKATINIVVGTQWGDEGKGKQAAYLANDADVSIRATGGNNAGHSIKVGGKKYALNLVPGAIAHGVKSIIGPGVVANPEVLLADIKKLRDGWVKVDPDVLRISENTHVILPYHQDLDAFFESQKDHKVGTTGKGIGPAYMDKCNRTGIRMHDLLLPVDELTNLILQAVRPWNFMFKAAGWENKAIGPVEAKLIAITYHKYGEILRNYICNVGPIIQEILDVKGKIVIEGAQAFRLDLDHGDYPMVTSSSPNASGTLSGAGIGPSNRYDINVIGVAKAYTSRVGEGPFATEQFGDVGDYIRELGHEYGTTTGRPRRCGWPDFVLLNDCKNTLGVTKWAVNHLDTLGKIGQKFGGIKVCTSYTYKGKEIFYVPQNAANEEIIPNYIFLDGGWEIKLGTRNYDDLPHKAQNFISEIENYTGIPVKYIGIGPGDEDMIVR